MKFYPILVGQVDGPDPVEPEVVQGGLGPSSIVATGGAVTEYDDADGQRWRLHDFTGTDALVVSDVGDAEIVIGGAGGGAGFHHYAGGGGSGGLYLSAREIPLGSHTVTIGAGGSGGSSTGESALRHGSRGSDSSFLGILAKGGGGGLGATGHGNPEQDGGSGGGHRMPGVFRAGYGDEYFGNDGGVGYYVDEDWMAGAGGGAGGPGQDGTAQGAGDAGLGVDLGWFFGVPSLHLCPGGVGGSEKNGVESPGTYGNAAPGGASANQPGPANTGAGGSPSAQNGGSGRVAIRYRIAGGPGDDGSSSSTQSNSAEASGGTEGQYTDEKGINWTLLDFTASDNLVVSKAGWIEVEPVGAGGSGGEGRDSQFGSGGAGGAGSGGVVFARVFAEVGTYPVEVGAGGGPGAPGSNSSALGVIAQGGGFAPGANNRSEQFDAISGGSGAGASRRSSASYGAKSTQCEEVFGGRGSSGGHSLGQGGGGGGGTGGNGEDSTGNNGGLGGAGSVSRIAPGSVVQAAGGHGGHGSASAANGADGAANTGNGGDGGDNGPGGSLGGQGGSGRVRFRFER